MALDGPVTVLSPRPLLGPWLWRRGDASSGEGIRQALQHADRVVVITSFPEQLHGLGVVLRPEPTSRPGVFITPFHHPPPAALTDVRPTWTQIRTGPISGEHAAPIQAWRTALHASTRLRLADPGTIPWTPAELAVEAVRQALQTKGARWVLPAEALTLRALAQRLAEREGRPLRTLPATLGQCARQVGLNPETLARWATLRAEPADTPGWERPDTPWLPLTPS